MTLFDQDDIIHGLIRPTWDKYFLNIAVAVSARADCRRSQHGAVIVKGNRIVSTGYNGSPPGGASCLAGECPRGLMTKEELPSNNSDYSNCIALHAEQNAIAYASRADTEGSTIYITGKPCDMCTKLIAAAGIERTVYRGQPNPEPITESSVPTWGHIGRGEAGSSDLEQQDSWPWWHSQKTWPAVSNPSRID